MIRYYLVPAEARLDIGMYLAPVYVESVTPTDRAFLPADKTDGAGPKWLRNWYVLKLDRPTSADFEPWESDTSCYRITRANIIAHRTAVENATGLDLSNLTTSTPISTIRRVLRNWLQEINQDFE
jgi:hypothetical protein